MAKLVSKDQSTIHDWLRLDKPLPAEYVFAVEAATGVSRHDLRPDIYPREDGAAQNHSSLHQTATGHGPENSPSSSAPVHPRAAGEAASVLPRQTLPHDGRSAPLAGQASPIRPASQSLVAPSGTTGPARLGALAR